MAADTVDISRWQGVIPASVFTQWRGAGIRRVVVKAGGGDAGTRYKDSCFDANRANATAAGLLVDAYWFNGHSDPAGDAQFIHSFAPGIRIWFDVENEKFLTSTMPHWTPTQLNAAARTAASLGHEVGCYMSSSVTYEANWSGCTWIPLWVANYSAKTVPAVKHWPAPVMWQYTSKGSLPGHSGYLDLSVTVSDFASAAPAAPITLGEKMIRIQSTNRGIALIGAGFFRQLVTDEEVTASDPIIEKSVTGNDRQFDLWRSMALGVTDLVTDIHKAVTQPVPRDGVNITQAQDNMNTGTLARQIAAQVQSVQTTVTTPAAVDTDAVAAAVVAKLPPAATAADVQTAVNSLKLAATS